MDTDKIQKIERFLATEMEIDANRMWCEHTRYLLDEVARLRGGIEYALDGPDVDLPEPLGGRAVAGCKQILRDVLAETEGYRGGTRD